MTRGDGDGIDDATDVIETGRVVELGSVNTRLIAENSTQSQDKIAGTIVGPDLRARFDAATAAISALAELFPAAFVADVWKPHRPLKLGIHRDLIDRGVLLPRECRALREPKGHDEAEAAWIWLWGCAQVTPKLAHRFEPMFLSRGAA